MASTLPVAEQSTAPGDMQLLAAGFNAWGQLQLSPSTSGRNEEPEDIFEFTLVLQDSQIGRPLAQLTSTLFKTDAGTKLAGVDARVNACRRLDVPISGETAAGTFLVAENDPSATGSAPGLAGKHVLAQYLSLGAWEARSHRKHWPAAQAAKQIAAYEVGFVVLFEDGSVASLGDARFEDCLGREVSEARPAGEPGAVSDLGDLGEPVKHVAAGGYTAAALTESGAVYAWGMPSIGSRHILGPFSSLSGTPNYIEIDGGKDIQDIALGESHAIALTTDGDVYVIGGNRNGQLGLGRSAATRIDSWTRVDPGLAAEHAVVGVAAGPRSSFVLTKEVTSKENKLGG